MSQQSDNLSNPYAAVVVEPPRADPSSQADEIRRQYLSHEASVKSIGVLYLLGAIFLVPAGLALMGMAVYGMITADAKIESAGFLMEVGIVALGVLQGMTGLALRKLKSWARSVGILFSAIGLIGFPIGTLISGYFLYLLISKKGVYVFSEEYQQVIAATPHIKYKTSIVVWIFLGLLVGLIGLGVVAALIGGLSR